MKQELQIALRILIIGLAGAIGSACFLALVPLLGFLSYLAMICLGFGAFYLIAVGMIDLRRRWLHSSIVPLGEYGGWHTKRLEQLHPYPLALPAPISVQEVKNEKPELDTAMEWRILQLRQKNMSLRDIVKATDIPYNKVQSICADWQKKLSGDA